MEPQELPPELCDDCWCLPSDGKGGTCPPFDLVAEYDRPTIAKYLQLGLPRNYENNPSQTLCYPSLDHLNLPPYSIPIPFLPDDGAGLPLCSDVMGRESSNSNAVCGFRYETSNGDAKPTQPCHTHRALKEIVEEVGFGDNDGIETDSHPFNPNPDVYYMETYASKTDASNAQAFISHTGACGYCSSAQDLGVYLNSEIDLFEVSFQCYFAWTISTDPNRNDQLILCMQQQTGMTANCALAWAVNMYLDSLPSPPFTFSCLGQCIALVTNPIPTNKDDCTLNDCLQCDEDVAGPIFIELAGRSRRNSGILSDITRSCEEFAEIRHDLTCNMMN